MGRDEHLLWWGVLDEVDALLDVALEATGASSKELLLLLGDTLEHIGGLLGAVGLYILLAPLLRNGCSITYTKGNKSREEVNASCLGDFITASDTGQVDKGGFDDACLAFESLDDTLGESTMGVSSNDHFSGGSRNQTCSRQKPWTE